MRSPVIHDGDRAAFYRASLAALRFCDAREARSRRFGPDTDSAWLGFAGDMRASERASERIDLLLRDADVQWPQAFAPRLVFGLVGLADDEPFGAAWASLEPALAEELWQTITFARLRAHPGVDPDDPAHRRGRERHRCDCAPRACSRIGQLREALCRRCGAPASLALPLAPRTRQFLPAARSPLLTWPLRTHPRAQIPT